MAIKTGLRKRFLTSFIDKYVALTDIPKIIFADILVQDLTHKIPMNRPDISHVLHFPLFWDTSMQISFLQNLFNYVVKDDSNKFESNWDGFFDNKWLLQCFKMQHSENKRENILSLLDIAGITTNDDASKHISFEVCRAIRNNITHFMEPSKKRKRKRKVNMEELLMALHERLPFLLPLLWVSYRYLQIPKKYPEKLNNVKPCIQEYYHAVKGDIDPNSLVTNLNFIRRLSSRLSKPMSRLRIVKSCTAGIRY